MTYYYYGTHGNDSYDYLASGGHGWLKAYGYGGNDSIKGSYGNDTIYGGDGKDTLDSWEGNDLIYVQKRSLLLYPYLF